MNKRNYIIIALAVIGIIYGFVFFYSRTMEPDDILKTRDDIIREQIAELEQLRAERDVRVYTDEELQDEISNIREMRRNR